MVGSCCCCGVDGPVDNDVNEEEEKSGDCTANRSCLVPSLVPSSFVVVSTLFVTTVRVVFVFFCLDVGVDAGDNEALQLDAAEG